MPQEKHATTVAEFATKVKAAGIDLDALSKDAIIIVHAGRKSEDELSRAARAVALLRALGFANAHNGGSPDAVRAALHATAVSNWAPEQVSFRVIAVLAGAQTRVPVRRAIRRP